MQHPELLCCARGLETRTREFAKTHQVSDGGVLQPYLYTQVDTVLPGLFDLLRNPQQWTGEFDPIWFPVSPKMLAGEHIVLEVVQAPLPFVGVVLRFLCEDCGRSYRIVHIGSNFFAMTSHLSATLVGCGLSEEDFARFVKELHGPDPRFSDHAAPYAVPRDIVAYGMAWIMCHEIAHFASPKVTAVPELSVSENVLKRLSEEINADSMSFRILMNRIHATPYLGKDRVSSALLGVFLVLNAVNLLLPTHFGRRTEITEYGCHVGAWTPSPTLRWNAVKNFYDVQVDLGIIKDEFSELKENYFPDITKRLQVIQEKFGEFCI